MDRRLLCLCALLVMGAVRTAQAQPPDFAPDEAGYDDGLDTNTLPPEMVPEFIKQQQCGREGHECGPPRGFWGRLEFIEWWVRGSDTPALVTTSPQGTPQAQAGVLPNATVLFGNERIDGEGRAGARATLGYWMDDCETFGVESTTFGLEQAGTTFSRTSTGNPILARPFFNVQTQANDATLTAFPNVVSGTITVRSNSQVFGTEVNARKDVYEDWCARVDFIGGYRFLRFDEDLNIFDNTIATDPAGVIPVGTTINVSDLFGTQNSFHGGNMGFLVQHKRQCWSLDVLAKLALGGMQQRVTINGSTVTTVPGQASSSATGGVLALPSNIGDISRTRFSAVPELDINFRYQLTRLWRFNVGYTFMYVTNVARPGDQISLSVDPRQFPPPVAAGAFPAFRFNDSDLWLHGINLGLEARF